MNETRMSSLLVRAKVFAERYHSGQTREGNGEPYINHSLRVARSFADDRPVMRLVGILHDVLEDTTASLQDIYNLFEFGDDRIANEVLGAVDAMTRRKDENYLDFILRVKANPIALEVKLADLEDNMRDLPEGTRKDKYRLAHYVLKQQPKEIVHGDLTSES